MHYAEKRGDLLGFLCGSFAAAAALRGPADGRIAHQLGSPNRGDELLHPMAIEIDGGALACGLGHGAEAVLLVTYRLPF